MRATSAVILVSVLAASASTAFAADEQDVLERVVVRNRLYGVSGKWEVGPSVGFTVVNRLTDHINFNLDAAYNLSDQWALELRGGYALSNHTGLARHIVDRGWPAPTPRLVHGHDFTAPESRSRLQNRWMTRMTAMSGSSASSAPVITRV